MKQTKAAIRFTSNQKNRYLADRNKRQVLLCHPLLDYIINLNEQGVDLDKWLRDFPDRSVNIEKTGKYSKKEAKYYYQKFLFLKKHGYCGYFNYQQRFNYHMEPDHIHESLANVRQVVFEVTDACNLKCEYCGYGKYYTDYDKRSGKKLDIRVAKKLLDYLHRLWSSNLNLSYGQKLVIGFYGGEPLLNFPFIQKIVEYVLKMKIPRHHFNFAITTNALLLEKHIDFLHTHQFYTLISLDGNRHNNSYRVFPNGQGAFDHILQNIRAVQQRHPDYFKNYVTFNSVFHNRSSIEDIHSFFKKKFAKMPTIKELNTNGINPNRKKEFWETYANIQHDFNGLKKPQPIIDDMLTTLPLINSTKRFIHKYTDSTYMDYQKVISTNQESKWLPTGTCFPFLRKIFVTVNCKILPCEKIGQQYSLGFVTPKKVKIDFNRVAEIYQNYFKKLTRLCKQCYESDHCGNCLFNTKIEKTDPQCDMFKTYEDCKNYFSSHLSFLEHNPNIYSKILEEVIYE